MPVDLDTRAAGTPVRGGRDRVIALDVLRGMAILGTLATNIGIFIALDVNDVGGTLDRAVSFTWSLITNGYWIGLLTVMFGIGLMIQRESALRRGEPWLGSYPWRAVVLIVEGTVNYFFVVPFDVLMGYGLTALVICVVVVTPRRVQAVVLVLGVVAHLAYLLHLTQAQVALDARFADGGDLGSVPGAEEGGKVVSVGGGSDVPGYWDMVRSNYQMFWDGGRAEIPIMVLMGIGVFLIGARLWEAGLFRAEGAGLRRRMMWVGFGIGLPVDWGLRTIMFFDPEGPVSEWASGFVRYGTALVVMIGVMALVAGFYVGRERTGRMGSMLVPVGRAALTCYLLQNVIAIVLFESYALDLDARLPFSLGVFAPIVAFLLISVILIVGATLWLRRFERGPMEIATHAAHTWLVRNTTGRVLARRRRAEPAVARDRE